MALTRFRLEARRVLQMATVSLLFGSGALTHAATYTAASTSYADVLTAIRQTKNGDTVNIPAGTNLSWTSQIIITNCITISGAGTNSTQIGNAQAANSGNDYPLFQIAPMTDGPVTIKNIWFVDPNGLNCAINSWEGNPIAPTQVRITGCVFQGFDFAIMSRAMYGVVDHCMFFDNRIVSRCAGLYATSDLAQVPAPPWGWDSTNTWCFEDDMMSVSTSGAVEYFGDTELPAAYTIRNCTFNVALNGGNEYDGFDMHGDGNFPSGVNGVGVQIYNNVFNYSWPNGGSAPQPKLTDIRGGVGSLVYSNIVNGTTAYAMFRANPAGSVAPANSYFWANMANGSALSPSDDGTATLGVNYFTTQPAGFKQLIYPHPLVSGSVPGPSTNPVIAVTPSSLDFGFVASGSSSNLMLKVQNVGGGTLVGTANGLSGPFSVSNATYSLGSNASQVVTVHFSPTQPGITNESLTFSGGTGAIINMTGNTLLGSSFDSTAGTITAPFVINSDNTISQSVQTTDPSTGGRAAYGFSLSTSGNYAVAAMVYAPSSDSDSLFVNIDAEPTTNMIWNIPDYAGLTNEVVTWGTSTTPQVWSLNAGTHQLIIRGREAGVKVGHIIISVPPVPPANLHIMAAGN